MNDATFYEALKQCFTKNKNCTQCSLYGYGYRKNDRCIRMLRDEIDHRKLEAHIKEDEVNE